MRIYSVLTTFVLILVLGCECAKKQVNSKCNEKIVEKIDKQMSPLIPILSGGKFPENEKQLLKYCSGIPSPLESAAAYFKTCGGTFGPFISKTLITDIKKEINSVCKLRKQKTVDRVLTASKCANSVSNKITKCVNNILDTMTAMQSVPFEDKMNTGCCHAYRIVSCIQKAVVKSKRCDKQMIETVERQVLTDFGDFCGQYFSNNQKCNKLVTKTPKLNTTYVRPKSMFPPLVALMDSYRNVECTPQREQRLDDVIQQLLTIGTPEKIPENSEQLDKWFNNAIQSLPYAYGYIESCLSDFGRFLIKVMVGAVSSNFGQYYGNNGKRALDNPLMQEYFNAAKCGNKAEDKLEVCFDEFNYKIMGIVEAPEMSRIKMACCNAYNFRTCIFNATSTTRGCSAQTIEWAERQVLNNVESAINLICNDLWGNNKKCDQLMAQIPRLDEKTYVKPKSPFFPMIKMLDSFPDVDLEQK